MSETEFLATKALEAILKSFPVLQRGSKKGLRVHREGDDSDALQGKEAERRKEALKGK